MDALEVSSLRKSRKIIEAEILRSEMVEKRVTELRHVELRQTDLKTLFSAINPRPGAATRAGQDSVLDLRGRRGKLEKPKPHKSLYALLVR
jgi:hypothetical protein